MCWKLTRYSGVALGAVLEHSSVNRMEIFGDLDWGYTRSGLNTYMMARSDS